MKELDKMRAVVNFFYLDVRHDDGLLDSLQLKHQFYIEDLSDHMVFLCN